MIPWHRKLSARLALVGTSQLRTRTMPNVSGPLYYLIAIFVAGVTFTVTLLPAVLLNVDCTQTARSMYLEASAAHPAILPIVMLTMTACTGCIMTEFLVWLGLTYCIRTPDEFSRMSIAELLRSRLGREVYTYANLDRIDFLDGWAARVRMVGGSGVALLCSGIGHLLCIAICWFGTQSGRTCANLGASSLLLCALGGLVLRLGILRGRMWVEWVDMSARMQYELHFGSSSNESTNETSKLPQTSTLPSS